MQEMIEAFWQVLNINLSINNVTYNLLDVFYCSLILIIIDLFFSKVVFISLHKR